MVVVAVRALEVVAALLTAAEALVDLETVGAFATKAATAGTKDGFDAGRCAVGLATT